VNKVEVAPALSLGGIVLGHHGTGRKVGFGIKHAPFKSWLCRSHSLTRAVSLPSQSLCVLQLSKGSNYASCHTGLM
jgi:hypothetical protein